jgi:hypothetical protein
VWIWPPLRNTTPYYLWSAAELSSFILPNEASSQSLSVFAVSAARVEQMTGIDLNHLLPYKKEDGLESTFEDAVC